MSETRPDETPLRPRGDQLARGPEGASGEAKSTADKQTEVYGPPLDTAVRDLQEDLRQMLDDLSGLITAAMVEADVGGPPPDQRAAFIDQLLGQYDPQHFFVTGWAHDELARAEPLVGTLEEIRTAVMIRVRELASNRPALRAFYGGTLAATVDRLLRENISTVDRHVDIILDPLERFLGGARVCSPSFLEFVTGLHAHLERLPRRSWDVNLIITLVSLANFIGNRESRECLLTGTYYFHEVMLHYLRAIREQSEDLGRRDLMQIRIAANNSANFVDEVRRLRDQPPDEQQPVAVRHHLKRISAALSVHLLELNDEERRDALQGIDHFFGRQVAEPSWPILLDDMVSSPTAWLADGRTYAHLAVAEGAGAVSRIAVEKRRYEAPGMFYNVGISLLRLADLPGGVVRTKVEAVRSTVNALGLWWALEAAAHLGPPQSVLVALTAHNGLECAVNLMAAAASLSPDRQQRQLLADVATMILAFQPLLPQEAHRFFQIETHRGQLNVGVAAPEDGVDPARLQQAVEELLAGGANGGFSLREPHPIVGTTELLRQAFHSVFDKQRLDSLIDELLTLLREIEEESRDPLAAIVTYYEPMAENGPLVASGLMPTEEWSHLPKRVSRPDVTLVDLLRSDSSFNWFYEE